MPPHLAFAAVQLPAQPGQNARLVAVLAADEARVEQEFQIELEDRPIVLRDDGLHGDGERGDRVFAADLALGAADIEALQPVHSLTESLSAAHFEDRVRVLPGSPKELLAKLKKGFDLSKLVPLLPLPGASVDPARSLMITDPHVVEDPRFTFNPCAGTGTPDGPWTFGHLMSSLANQPLTGIDPSDFVRTWLAQWETDQIVNGVPVPARLNIQSQIIAPWELASGGPGHKLDLAKAPFRLLAIVNRVDLRDNVTYGGSNAGEGRFVFCAMDAHCNPLQFTVIFEYGVPKHGCFSVRKWAQDWLALSALPLGSTAYNDALLSLTKQFAEAGMDPSRPNRSALNQLRTNEISLAAPWELREFHLQPAGGTAAQLRMATTRLTPMTTFAGTATLAGFVNANPPAPPVPDTLAGAPFVGGDSLVPSPGFFWDGPPVPPGPDIAPADKRFQFSNNTCNGCHAGETATFFTHVKPAPFGSAAGLSGFLTGTVVADPADGSPTRSFNDLERRRIDLETLASKPCLFQFPFVPLKSPH